MFLVAVAVGLHTSGILLIVAQDGTLVEDLLVIDSISEMYVIGCTVDYVCELGGSYLKVINPQAKSSCGCGESFAV